MSDLSHDPPWRSYRWLTCAAALASTLAAGLHLLWMPHVTYDPFAPFRVLWMTLEGSYFPVAALLTWLAARAHVWRTLPRMAPSPRHALPNILLTALADARHETPDQSCGFVRRLLA